MAKWLKYAKNCRYSYFSRLVLIYEIANMLISLDAEKSIS